MAAQIFTAKGENFEYTNNTGGNARIIINSVEVNSSGHSGQGNSVPIKVQWGTYTTKGTKGTTEAYAEITPNEWFGRNTKCSDKTCFRENPDNYMYTLAGGPCEYYIADGERFSLWQQNTQELTGEYYWGIRSYNIMVIPDSAGTVYNGQGEFNYTNNTEENVRLIMGYLAQDGGGNNSYVRIYWGATTATQSSSTTGDQNGVGKWCMVNNPLNNGGFSSGIMENYKGPNEFWLAPGDFFSVSIYNAFSSGPQATVGPYSFLVMPESGT